MRLVAATLVLLLAAIAAGCSSSSGGTLNLHVTDAPDAIGDFRALNVTVSKITLNSNDGKSKDYDPSASTFDLTKLTSGNLTTLFAGTVDGGNYTKLTLHVQDANGVLKANGASASVKAPSGQLFLTTAFTVASGQQTDFVFDIQVHQEGNGSYLFQPNASGSGPKAK